MGVLGVQKRTPACLFYSGCLLLTFGEHAAKCTFHFFAISGRIIPVDSALQSISKSNFWLPTQPLLCQGVVCDAIERTSRPAGPQFYLGLAPREVADHSCRVDDLYAFHRSQMDGRAVVDFSPATCSLMLSGCPLIRSSTIRIFAPRARR
jgi:hypothetical protein